MTATTYPKALNRTIPSSWGKKMMALVAIIAILGILIPLAQSSNPKPIEDIMARIQKGCTTTVNLEDYVFEPVVQGGQLVSLVVSKKGVPKELLSVFYNLEPSMNEFRGVSELAWKGTVENKVTNVLLQGEGTKLMRAADIYVSQNSSVWVRNFNDQNRFGWGGYLACARLLSNIIVKDGSYISAFMIVP